MILHSGTSKPVDAGEKERVEGVFRYWRGARERRKRAFLELEGMLLDAGVLGRVELWVSDLWE